MERHPQSPHHPAAVEHAYGRVSEPRFGRYIADRQSEYATTAVEQPVREAECQDPV
jgi:hypothetical protein